MRIELDVKLGFKNVMIRPKRSTLKSRSEVSLDRTFKFMHASGSWTGIPVMAANMDTVGTFEMAKALSAEKLFTVIHKHYSLQQWDDFLASVNQSMYDYISVSTGTSEKDAIKLDELMKKHSNLRFICIDVANGYSEHFVDFVKKTRDRFPEKV